MNECAVQRSSGCHLEEAPTWTVHVGTETTQGKLTVLSQKMGGSILREVKARVSSRHQNMD